MRYWLFVGIVMTLIFGISAAYLFITDSPELIKSQPQSYANPTPSVNIPVGSITLESFFDAVQTAKYPAQDVWTLRVTGDIIPGRSVNYKSVTYNNFQWAFEPTASFLKDADLTYVNLEAPIISECPVTNEGMIFCGDARHTQGLSYAGVDVANLANNHVGNHGLAGVQETARHLQKIGIIPSGIENNPQYTQVRENKIAFLGYDDIEFQPGVSRADPEIIQREVKEAKANADLVIVQFHWGIEYVSQPSNRQRELGKLAIDSGADLVIGNHPHWIQPVELYNGKLITYAHGNYIFDQMWSEKTKEGVVGDYYFYKNQLIDVEYTPIKIEDYGQAQIITDQSKKEVILHDMHQQSIQLAQ